MSGGALGLHSHPLNYPALVSTHRVTLTATLVCWGPRTWIPRVSEVRPEHQTKPGSQRPAYRTPGHGRYSARQEGQPSGKRTRNTCFALNSLGLQHSAPVQKGGGGRAWDTQGLQEPGDGLFLPKKAERSKCCPHSRTLFGQASRPEPRLPGRMWPPDPLLVLRGTWAPPSKVILSQPWAVPSASVSPGEARARRWWMPVTPQGLAAPGLAWWWVSRPDLEALQ